MKNLQGQNLHLQEKFNSLQAQQRIVLCKLEALEERQRSNPIQLDDRVSSAQQGESNRSILLEELSDHYSPVNSPPSCMPSTHSSHFLPAYHPPSHASDSYQDSVYTCMYGSQQDPQLPRLLSQLSPPPPDHTLPPPRHALPPPRHTPPLSYQSFQQASSQGNAKCIPIKPKKSANTLPSTAICKEALMPTSQAFAKHHKLLVVSKAPTLATKLARDAYFGEGVLRRCTVMGCREQPGLPIQELNDLKQTMFSKFPQYWQNPVEFEDLWSQCVDGIGQLCKRLRKSVYT